MMTQERPPAPSRIATEYEDHPTVQVWVERYKSRPGGMLSDLAIAAQEGIIGTLFRGDEEDIRYCIDSCVNGHWFGLDVFAAACDAILALPGAGETDIDVLAVRDALVNADCLGSRPYQIPASGWCRLADRASWLPVDVHIDRLCDVYRAEANRIQAALMERRERAIVKVTAPKGDE